MCGREDTFVTPQICKSHNFCFTDFSLRYIEEKKLLLLQFSSNFYEISHNDSKDIFRTHTI